jgi:hypothetical protein
MKRFSYIVVFILVFFLTSCGARTVPALINTTKVPVITSPSELPVSQQKVSIVWNGKIIQLSDQAGVHSIRPSEKTIEFYALSNDYRFVAFNTWNLDKGADQIDKQSIILMDLHTGIEQVLAKEQEAFPKAKFISSLAFSPDNKFLLVGVAFEEKTNYLEINLDNGEYKWVSVDSLIFGADATNISTDGQILDVCSVIKNNKVDLELCLFNQNGNLIRNIGTDVFMGGKFLPD